MNTVSHKSIREAFLELAPARATLYEFLSVALVEPPTREAIQALADISTSTDLANGMGSAVADGLQTLSELAQCVAGSDAQLQALRQEYMDLFRVPGGKYVTPYESVYRDTREIEGKPVKGLLLGPSALDVQKWYRLAAAEMNTDVKELPDHIGILVAFMAYLCHKEQEFAATGDISHVEDAWRIEREFITIHIISWVATLTSSVRSKVNDTLYNTILDLVLRLAKQDAVILSDCLEMKTALP